MHSPIDIQERDISQWMQGYCAGLRPSQLVSPPTGLYTVHSIRRSRALYWRAVALRDNVQCLGESIPSFYAAVGCSFSYHSCMSLSDYAGVADTFDWLIVFISHMWVQKRTMEPCLYTDHIRWILIMFDEAPGRLCIWVAVLRTYTSHQNRRVNGGWAVDVQSPPTVVRNRAAIFH